MTRQQKGTCYLCGHETAKAYMGRHLLSTHLKEDGDQECILVKIEDEHKEYWLFIDIAASSSLATLDSFLRSVWLECCGHMSAFMIPGTYEEVGMSRKLSGFAPGVTLRYEYDFGSTTTLFITFLQRTSRPAQRASVRVLARNAPYEFTCEKCGKPAKYTDVSGWPGVMYCTRCANKLVDSAYLLPITNSPRMGVCGYCGEFDKYQYRPGK